jgi:hypothetical protein
MPPQSQLEQLAQQQLVQLPVLKLMMELNL